MKIVIADYICTPSGYRIGEAVAFDRQIRAIGVTDALTAEYPDAEIIRTPAHSVLYPGLINTHVHLEFSSNKTTLAYGDFIPWLHSVIEHRGTLTELCDDATMAEACHQMLRSGITGFGAISSFGLELEVCKRAPQKVTFFNELIGSDAKTADMLYGDFLERVGQSETADETDKITPAIAIHAPYSVHPIVLQRAISLARQKQYPLSAHFLESPAEKEWLASHSGGFAAFFEKFFGSNKAVTSAEEFLQQFHSYPTHFVHCVQTSKAQKQYLAAQGHSVAHCPRSNRLLGCGRLAIEDVEGTMSIATDGLSSNWSLSLWDEMRAALMLHHQAPLEKLADRFIRSVTSDAAQAIRSDAGRLEAGAPADITVITLPSRPEQTEALSLYAILHTRHATQLYIDGEKIL